MRGVPWWGVASSAAAPVLLIGGWTVAAMLQPGPFNPVVRTISALAAEGAADRWVMTLALVGVGACFVMTGLALRLAAAPRRILLLAGGVATILAAANPEPTRGGGSVPHTFWAAVGFVALAAWPAGARGRGRLVPYGLRPTVSPRATGVLVGLLAWFCVELVTGGHQIGLAERVLAGAEVTWLLIAVLTCYGSQSLVS